MIIALAVTLACTGDKVEVIENRINSDSDTNNLEFKTLTFFRVPFTDSLVTQDEVINLLIPEGYSIKQSIVWKTKDYSDPLKFSLELRDTAGFNIINFFPNLTFITNTSSLPLNASSIKIDKDTIYESSNMPKNAIDALVDYVLPVYVPSYMQARIIIKKPLYNIHQTNAENKEINAETACIHIEFSEHGNQYEQVLYATLEKQFLHVESYNTTCEWRIKNIVSIKTAKGFLNNNMAIFQTIINSARLTPVWTYYYTFICNNNFRNKKNISIDDYIKRFQSSPSLAEAQELNDYHTKQNILRKTFAAYSMYLNHLEYYIDKDGVNVALPEGFIAAWSSTSSQIRVTKVPNYRPETSETNAWVQIRRNESQLTYYYLDGSSAPEVGDPLFENPLYH